MRYFNDFNFEALVDFGDLIGGTLGAFPSGFDTGLTTHHDSFEALDFGELYKLGLAPDSYMPESLTPGSGLSYAAKDGRLFLDIPGNTSTTATAIVNGSVSDTLEVVGDQDWFEVTLTAGQRYTFALDGSGASALVDPLVRLLDASGGQLATNDDGGPGRNSLLTFDITTTGTYYVSAQAWGGAGVADGTGDYTLTINEAAPITERTIDGIAHFLTDEFRSRSSYNSGGGGATTINFSFASGANSMTAAQETLARQALDAWADIANINFVEGAGDIVFRNNSSGAFNSNTTNGAGLVLSSDLNITASWNGGNTNVDSYTYQTFMHEIGHALGLGHAGPYNGSATYGVDNSYLNDSWAYTVMSYFDQNESGYFGDYRFVLGPQIADILAIQDLYGVNTTTRNGDTVYGYNSTETDVHNFSQFTRAPSLSIYDTGGIDTLDVSGYSANARIDLRDEAFSDVDNIRSVISIARGTVIENAIGGSGADNITGNAVSNELTGGAGNDILDGGEGIDYALYSGAAFANYTITDNGDGTFTVTDNVGTDGSDTLSNIEFISIAGVNYVIGATELTSNADTFIGTAATDNVDGLAGNDTISGFAGDDILNGGSGNDILNGGSGNDIIITGLGADTVDGGAGTDTVDYTDSTNIQTINLITNVNIGGYAHDDNLTSIENVIGSNTRVDDITGNQDANILDGQGADDYLRGHNGDDTLLGGTGNDFLYGGRGADTLDGGSGNDWVMYNGLTTGVTVNLLTGIGSGGQAEGDTYTSIERIRGSAVDDVLTGDNSNNKILGDDGNDTINGNGGKDNLRGGAGNDTIDGGTGNDALRGDAGNDIFVFDHSILFDVDSVLDFTQGSDVVDILSSSFGSFADIFAAATDFASYVQINVGSGDFIRLFGITKAALTSADFLLDGVAAAEAPAIDKAIVLDPVDAVDKPVVSDDDSFVFVDKLVVSEDLLGFGGVDGDFVIDQDVMADFLAQAQAEFDFNTDVVGRYELGIDAELNHHDYFTDFFSIV